MATVRLGLRWEELLLRQLMESQQFRIQALRFVDVLPTLKDDEELVRHLREYFGEEITVLVDGLTKIAHISNLSREKQQAENVRKMVLAMITDVRVVLIKLADRLHNMRTMQFLKPDKRARISQETLDIYAPIAHRLGMGKMRSELEDLAFQNLYPDEYKRLAKEVDARRPELEAALEAGSPVRTAAVAVPRRNGLNRRTHRAH